MGAWRSNLVTWSIALPGRVAYRKASNPERAFLKMGSSCSARRNAHPRSLNVARCLRGPKKNTVDRPVVTEAVFRMHRIAKGMDSSGTPGPDDQKDCGSTKKILFETVGGDHRKLVDRGLIESIAPPKFDSCSPGFVAHQAVDEIGAMPGRGGRGAHCSQHYSRIPVPLPGAAVIAFADVAQRLGSITDGFIVRIHAGNISAGHNESSFPILRMCDG